jgi:hypothetical protein
MNVFHKSIIFWQEKVALFETQNMTQAEFCAQNKLNAKTFCNWRKRLEAQKRDNTKAFVSFSANVLPIVTSTQGYYDLTIKGKVKIRVTKYFDPELLVRIIKTLEEV